MKLDFSDTKVLVIGDFMLDYYIIGESKRKSPEAEIPIILPIKKYSTAGGAGNVALNLSSMGAIVSCIGVVGNDQWGEKLIKLLSEKKIDTSNIIISDLYPTILKKRTYLEGKNIYRMDEEKILDNSFNEKINHRVSNIIQNYDIIILSDYNKGVLNIETIKHITTNTNSLIVVDPKKKDFSIYKGANILTPNFNELQRASKIKIKNNDSIVNASNNLIKENGFDYIVTTKGSKGMTIVGKDILQNIDAITVDDADVTGAGDTVVSVLSLSFHKTKDIEMAAKMANDAGSIVVSNKGTTIIDPKEFE